MMSVLQPADRLGLTYRLLMEAQQRIHALERQVRDLEQRLARVPIAPPESVFHLRCGAVIDPERRTITHQGKEAHFSGREWEIVDYLRQARRPVPKAELREYLYQGLCAENAVAIHLSRIRGRLRQVGAEEDLLNREGAWSRDWHGRRSGGTQARYELLLAPPEDDHPGHAGEEQA